MTCQTLNVYLAILSHWREMLEMQEMAWQGCALRCREHDG